MNILIKNLSNTYNYGSMMMGENLISRIVSHFKDSVSFYIDSKNESDLERLRVATKYERIYSDKFLKFDLITEKIKYVRYAEKIIREKLSYIKASNFYDAVIFLGGDDFAETYYTLPRDNKVIKKTLKEIEYFNNKTKVFMIGQTIGPYTEERKEWAKKYLSNVKIYTRDDDCLEYLSNELEIKGVKSRDLALLDLNLQSEYKDNIKYILRKYNLVKEEYITFVGTGLLDAYSDNKDKFVNGIVLTLEELIKRYPDKKIVYLSHVTLPKSSSDNKLIEIIKEKEVSKNITFIDESILPVEARMILGNGYVTITFRMHAAVSTFQMGKPAISLAYSKKYKGVIGNGLNMNDLIIDCRNNFNCEDMHKIVSKKLDYVDKNYNDICLEINKNVEICKKMVDKTLNEVNKILESDINE